MRIIKASLAVFIALISTASFAAINANSGFYVGADLAVYHYDRPSGAAIGGIAGVFNHIFPDSVIRPYLGYRFNDYLALEAGYNDIENESRNGNATWGPDRLRIYTYDLAAKGIVPFENGFSLFAKGGVGLTHQYVYNVVYTGNPPTTNYTTNRFQPLVGVGASYNYSKNFATDFSINQYFPSGSVGAISMVEIGLSYTFGDL